MKNSLLFILALCSASVLASPVDKSPSLPVQDSYEDLTPQVSNQLKNSDEDTSKPPTKDSLATVQGTTSTIQESHLQNLDRDIILDIFSRVTFRDVLNWRATCTSFQSISTETVEMTFLDNIRNYNRNYLRDQRLEPLLRQAFPYYDTDTIYRDLKYVREATSFPFNVLNHEQMLVECAQKEFLMASECDIQEELIERVESALTMLEQSLRKLPNIQPQLENVLKSAWTVLKTLHETDVISKLDELQSSLSTLIGSLRSLANSGESEVKIHVKSALTTLESLRSWPQNEDQVKDLVVSALKQVEKSFKNDEYDLDHNDELEMELAIASILHQRYARILYTRRSIELAKARAKSNYALVSRPLNAAEKANIKRGKFQTLGPEYEKILGLVHILQCALIDVKWRIKEHELEENADVEAEMIALLEPELGMDQDRIKKVFEQARWSVKLGFAVKYKLEHAVRGLLKSLEIFGRTTEEQLFAAGPTMQRHYNAAIKTKWEPLINAFEESGLAKETRGYKRKYVRAYIRRRQAHLQRIAESDDKSGKSSDVGWR